MIPPPATTPFNLSRTFTQVARRNSGQTRVRSRSAKSAALRVRVGQARYGGEHRAGNRKKPTIDFGGSNTQRGHSVTTVCGPPRGRFDKSMQA